MTKRSCFWFPPTALFFFTLELFPLPRGPWSKGFGSGTTIWSILWLLRANVKIWSNDSMIWTISNYLKCLKWVGIMCTTHSEPMSRYLRRNLKSLLSSLWYPTGFPPKKKRWNLGTVRSWKSRVQLCWWSPQFLAPERGLHSQNMLIMVTKSGSYSRSVHLKWPVWPPKKIIHDRLGLCRLCQIFQQTFQTLCPSPLLRTCLFPARLLWRAWRMPSAQPSPGFSREHQPHIRKSSSKFPFDSCKPKKWTWKLSSFSRCSPSTMYTCLAAAFAFPWQRQLSPKVVGKFPLVWVTPLIYCPSGTVTQDAMWTCSLFLVVSYGFPMVFPMVFPWFSYDLGLILWWAIENRLTNKGGKVHLKIQAIPKLEDIGLINGRHDGSCHPKNTKDYPPKKREQ